MFPESRNNMRFGERMIHGVQHRAERARAAEPDAERNDAHVLDAGIGQQPFVIRLAENKHRADDQRNQAQRNPDVAAEISQAGGDADLLHAESPRNAQFNTAPESSAETTDGASLCASGSQVCSGARPIFVP